MTSSNGTTVSRRERRTRAKVAANRHSFCVAKFRFVVGSRQCSAIGQGDAIGLSLTGSLLRLVEVGYRIRCATNALYPDVLHAWSDWI
jgi:hypothetical protein